MKIMSNYLAHLIETAPGEAISYAQYMSAALYHPDLGYYNQSRTKVGKEGDFITSVSVHPIFAKVIADSFHQHLTERRLPLTICEMGGAGGGFALEVIRHWRENYPDSYAELNYYIVEQSPTHRIQAEVKLAQYECVTIYSTLDELMADLASFNGVFFSNELFDALPVHVIKKEDQELKEIMVTKDSQDKLKEMAVPLENSEVLNWINHFHLELVNNHRYEIPLEMTNLLNKLSHWFAQTVFFTIDYGYTNDIISHPERKEGSLRGYYHHQMVTNPLLYPGEMDLTTHIPIDMFRQVCKENDMREISTMFQGEFLQQAGIMNYLENHEARNPFSEAAKRNRAIRSLLLGDFSRAFYVMLFEKY